MGRYKSKVAHHSKTGGILIYTPQAPGVTPVVSSYLNEGALYVPPSGSPPYNTLQSNCSGTTVAFIVTLVDGWTLKFSGTYYANAPNPISGTCTRIPPGGALSDGMPIQDTTDTWTADADTGPVD